MEQVLEKLTDVLKSKGFNITHQRLLVYKALVNSKEHPSTEDVYNEVRQLDPIISLGTVYKSLEMFENVGLSQKVNQLYHTARYDGNCAPHAHLICKKCEKIVDIFWDSPPPCQLSEEQEQGFRVDDKVMHFLGYCPDCRKDLPDKQAPKSYLL